MDEGGYLPGRTRVIEDQVEQFGRARNALHDGAKSALDVSNASHCRAVPRACLPVRRTMRASMGPRIHHCRGDRVPRQARYRQWW